MFISFFRHSTCQSARAHITLRFSLSPLRLLISHPQNISEKKLITAEISPRKIYINGKKNVYVAAF